MRRTSFDDHDAKIPPSGEISCGASAEHPIQKDKMFVFGDYEGYVENLSWHRRR